MKKYFTLMLLLIASMNFIHGMNSKSFDNDKTFIEISKNYFPPGDYRERSSPSYIVEAYYYDTNIVELELYKIGETYVSIMDSTGNIIDQATVCTDIPTTIYLDTSLAVGYIRIVISSNVFYGEGVVNHY